MTSSGYTLPVWVAAAAVAAVRLLRGEGSVLAAVPLWLQPDQAQSQQPREPIHVEAAALLAPDRALGISRCQPGDGLDLTRGLAVWVEAHWTERLAGQPWLQLEAGEGVGVLAGSSELCVSGFARALLADPRLLILDEATSAIDALTEARLQQALARLLAGRTSLVVAHRLSTIRHADLVLVLDRGRIVERGTHAELLSLRGHYAALHRQFVQMDDRT